MNKRLISYIFAFIILLTGFQVQASSQSISELELNVKNLKESVDTNNRELKKATKSFKSRLKKFNKELRKRRRAFERAKKEFIKIAESKIESNNEIIEELENELNNTSGKAKRDKIKGKIEALIVGNSDIALTLEEDIKIFDSNISTVKNLINQNNMIRKNNSKVLSSQNNTIKRLEKKIEKNEKKIEETNKKRKLRKQYSKLINNYSKLNKTILDRIETFNKMKNLIKK